MDNLNTTIKGYELRERIGAGGFGAVYRAYQSTVGREVAIKIILPHFANHPDFIRRFETEAQLIAKLEHWHIIPLYDYWRDPDGAYLVMRWLKGGSLREALQNGAYDLSATALFLDQIASALGFAHRNSVVHRDLKPGNILLDEDGNHYLADFGIAKDVGNLAGGGTQADAIVGSPDYLAPEQARAEAVTPATDIYSLGVVLYEVLTGKHPFPDANMVERLYKHLNDPLPLIENLPDAINTIVQKATAKNPAHRYPDVLALAAAFREAAGLNRSTSSSVVEILTQREQDILQRIIDGLSNKEIAQELFITVPTVKWYIRQIYAKLGVRSRVQAIVRARELNLIVSGDASRDIQITAGESNSLLLPEPTNPYKGLRAFQSADYRDFFGREALIQKLLKCLMETKSNVSVPPLHRDGEGSGVGTSRFLAVVGPSGSGKSSLVKAGLIPALWRGELPGSEKWFVVEMLPGSHPLDELEVALTRVAANQSTNLHEHLQRDDRGLLRAAQLILPNDSSELVLVIDQFEEVFTLVEDETARAHFLDNLVTAVTDPRSPVRVIITLRADFYDRPLHYPDFGELVRSHMETVLPLSAESLERAIARPAEQQGVTFEEGLIAKIVGEVNYQSGALPLLQYALTELFERREGRRLTHDAYRAIGGTVGALAKRADEIYDGLDDTGKETVKQMFLRLVALGEGAEDTRRRVPRSELLAIVSSPPNRNGEGLGTDVMDDLIDTFATYRLLSLDNDPGTRVPTVEVAHEAILREWERLRAWLDDSRDDIKMQRQLAVMASEWRAAKQDASYLARGSRLEQFENWARDTQLAQTPAEREYLTASLAERERQHLAEQERQQREVTLEHRSRNFLRGLVAVLLLATLGAFGLTGVAISQSNIAQSNETEARGLALASQAQAALNSGNAEQAIALANEANQVSPNPLAQAVLENVTYAPRTQQLFQETNAFVPGVFAPQKTKLKFVLIAHMGPQFPFAAVMIKGMNDACALLDVACQWISEEYLITDLKQMTGYWEKALTLNPDGIGTTLLDPNDIRGGVEQAVAQGIPVVIFNVAPSSDTNDSLPALLYIGSNEFVAGQTNARRVFAEAKADGITIKRGVCALQALNIPFIDQRCAGVRSIFEQEGVPLDQLRISYCEGHCEDSNEDEAKRIADYFKDNPETKAIFMLGPGPAASLNIYLKQAGLKPRQLYATAHDTSDEVFQMIRDGYLLQTADQQPYMQGFQTIMSLYLYRQYGVRPSGFINTSTVVDKSNVDLVIKLAAAGYR